MFINSIIYHHIDFLNDKSKYTFVWKRNFKTLISDRNKKVFLLDFTDLKVFLTTALSKLTNLLKALIH